MLVLVLLLVEKKLLHWVRETLLQWCGLELKRGSLGTTAFNPTVGSRLGNLPDGEKGGLLGERTMGCGSFVVDPFERTSLGGRDADENKLGKRLPGKTLGPCFFVGDDVGGVENC